MVELAGDHGQRMVTRVKHGTVITPGMVAEVIRTALRNGWTPQQSGREIVFRIEGTEFLAWPPPAQ